MAILIHEDLRLLVQGITGVQASEHTLRMMAYSTPVVGGVTPSKGGQWIHGVPVFDTVHEAVDATDANATIIFVPPTQAHDAIYEAVDAGIQTIVCITEHIPVAEMIRVKHYIADKPVCLIGPNSPGFLVPGRATIGIIPGFIAAEGPVGVIARSGTLMFEIVAALTAANIGQSTIVGIGADMITGLALRDILEMFEHDPLTEKIVLIGEIGGRAEFDAAPFIRTEMTKPIVAYIAGVSAPNNRVMGHSGAVVTSYETSASAKIEILRQVGVKIAAYPEDIVALIR